MRFRIRKPSLKSAELRALLEAAPTPMLISRVSDGLILHANTLLAETLGLPSESLIGRKILDFYAPADGEALLERLGEEGCVRSHEVRATKADGTPLWVVVSLQTAVFDGEPALIAGLHDITDSRRAEQALQESEENFKELSDSIADVFFAMDRNLKYTYWNKASENLTGISARDAIGKSLYDLFPEVRGTKADVLYHEVLTSGQPRHFVNDYELRGKAFTFEISAYPSATGLSVFVKDVSERKRAEQALRESEEKYRRLVQDSIDGIVIAEGQEIRFVNSALLDMIGCHSEEEMLGRPFTDFISPEYREELLERNRAREQGQAVPVHYEFKAMREDGSTFDAEVCLGRIAYQGRTATQAIVRDITERKQMARALQERREALERSVEGQMQRGNAYELTFRELTVLHLVAEGRSDREIGATLGISTMTIHKHVASILSKMKAGSRTDASVRAVREGFLD